MLKHTKSSLVSQLQGMGVEKGDTVLIRASLNKLGRIESPFKETLMESLLEAVGDDGTLVSLGFTKSFLFDKDAKKTENNFTVNTIPNIGALAKLFLKHPNSIRSQHPTNSYIAIGKHANEIVENHDESSLSYTPISNLIRLKGKMLLIGCIEDSPGFTTVHYAQEKLGLTQMSLISRLQKVYFLKNGVKTLFRRRDSGGCSAGFRNFYADYLEKNKLTVGYVGSASSLLINAEDAYTIEYNRMKENRKYFMCSNELCVSCRATWLFNLWGIPKYIFFKSINLIKSVGKK